MSSSNKVRVISLKEAANVNKKYVTYFTITDGTVAVVKKDDKGISQDYNSQSGIRAKYKKNLKNNKSNINMSQENKFSKNDDYEIYKIKNNNETENNYKRKNDISTNIQESNMSYLNKYKNKYLNTSPEKSYSYHSQIYINQNNQDSNRGQNNYKSRFQIQQNKNDSPEKGFSFRRQIYANQNKNNEQNNFSKKNDNQQNINDSQEKENLFKRKRYQKTNLNQPDNNKNQRQFGNDIQESYNTNFNNTNSYKNRNYGNTNDLSKNRAKSQYMMQNLRTQPNNKQNIYINTNINDSQNNTNYKYQILEAIPVKLCDNYNSQIRNFSHPKPQYVQPYINSEIIIQEIKFSNNNDNIDFARGFTSQITNSFNDFDNLEEYDEQGDFRNDELYKNVDLKYSDISQSGGILKNKIKKKYVRPFTNVEIKNNNNNSGFRLVRSQNNQTKNCNFKESVGSGANIRKFNRY